MMKELGAKEFYPRGEVNAAEDPEDTIMGWMEELWPKLNEATW